FLFNSTFSISLAEVDSATPAEREEIERTRAHWIMPPAKEPAERAFEVLAMMSVICGRYPFAAKAPNDPFALPLDVALRDVEGVRDWAERMMSVAWSVLLLEQRDKAHLDRLFKAFSEAEQRRAAEEGFGWSIDPWERAERCFLT